MIEFKDFKQENGIPIYTQILMYIKRGIIAGRIVDGDPLPSRRQLSALIGVNPNTVQKAFKLLEDEGLIQSSTGAKSVVSIDGAKIEMLNQEVLENDMESIVQAMKQMGISKEKAVELIEKFWEVCDE